MLNKTAANELPQQNHNSATSGKPAPQPRVYRLKDAPGYLGMDRNKFNAEVRPFITEIRMGKQSVAFDRLDLDDWFDDYKSRNGRPGQPKGELTWDERKHRASSNGMGSITLTNKSTDGAFAKAVKQIASKKRSAS